jgi:hypothetical protein
MKKIVCAHRAPEERIVEIVALVGKRFVGERLGVVEEESKDQYESDIPGDEEFLT